MTWQVYLGMALIACGAGAPAVMIAKQKRRAPEALALPPAPVAVDLDAHLVRGLAAIAEHEAGHHVKYTTHQRRRAVLRRVREQLHFVGVPEPPDLEQRVREAVQA